MVNVCVYLCGEHLDQWNTYSVHLLTLSFVVSGSAELRRDHVATVLGEEEGHALRYLPGESDHTVWPGITILVLRTLHA